MARTIGRRAFFFAVTVVVSLLLYYPTPAEFRWVPILTASLGAFWAVALAAEELSRPGPTSRQGLRGERARADLAGGATPFDPPPPPGGG